MSLGMLVVENPKVTYKRIDKRRLREYALSVHISASTGGVSGEVPVYVHALKAKDLVGFVDSMHCGYYSRGNEDTTVPWGVILNYPANRPKEIRGEKDPDIERDIGIVYDTMMEVTQRLLLQKKENERRRKVVSQVQAWCEHLGGGLWEEVRDAVNYQERVKALRTEVTGEIHRQVRDKYTEEYIAALLSSASNNLEPEVVGAVHQRLANAAEQYLSPIRVPFAVSEEDVFGKEEEDKEDE